MLECVQRIQCAFTDHRPACAPFRKRCRRFTLPAHSKTSIVLRRSIELQARDCLAMRDA
jgi:hypothetical protein